MIDKKIIGMALPAYSYTPDANQLRFFAKAIGETNPIYSDESAARDAGHPGLPLPPTYLFSAEIYRPASHSEWRDAAGIQLPRVLHGEQSFTYHRMAYAGDTLHFDTKIVDGQIAEVWEFVWDLFAVDDFWS